MKHLFLYLIFAFVLSAFSGCYTLSGISIPPDVKTFYVEEFRLQDNNSPATFGQNFAEALKDRVRQESSLIYTETDPHLEFQGAITGFRVTSEAPQAGELVSFNRLTINISVNCIDNNDDKRSWKSNFSFFSDFAESSNLLDVQEELIGTIQTQLLEDIYNKAFTNW